MDDICKKELIYSKDLSEKESIYSSDLSGRRRIYLCYKKKKWCRRLSGSLKLSRRDELQDGHL